MRLVKGTNAQGKEFYIIMKGPFVLQNVFGIVSHKDISESYEYMKNLQKPYDGFEPSSYLNKFQLDDVVEFDSIEELKDKIIEYLV